MRTAQQLEEVVGRYMAATRYAVTHILNSNGSCSLCRTLRGPERGPKTSHSAVRDLRGWLHMRPAAPPESVTDTGGGARRPGAVDTALAPHSAGREVATAEAGAARRRAGAPVDMVKTDSNTSRCTASSAVNTGAANCGHDIGTEAVAAPGAGGPNDEVKAPAAPRQRPDDGSLKRALSDWKQP